MPPRILHLVAVAACVTVSLLSANCGSSTPTTPTPSPAPAPAPAPAPTPAPTTAGIQGTVSNASGVAINGASVTVIDGPNAGQSVTTNANGSYRFNALAIANMNFSATASGYLEKRAGTFVNGTNGVNFVLEPVPPPPPPPAPAPSPTITIGTRIISGGAGTSIQEWGFSAFSNVTDYTSYDWSFGDGGTVNEVGSEEQHVYRAKGTYTVTVVGHRRQGDVTGTRQITVQ